MLTEKLIEQMRAQRRVRVPIGKFTFHALRPSDLEYAELLRDKTNNPEVAERFVEDWEGVTEADLLNGGGSDEVAFDRLVWREWCRDHQEFWQPIARAVLQAFADRARKLEDAQKN